MHSHAEGIWEMGEPNRSGGAGRSGIYTEPEWDHCDGNSYRSVGGRREPPTTAFFKWLIAIQYLCHRQPQTRRRISWARAGARATTTGAVRDAERVDSPTTPSTPDWKTVSARVLVTGVEIPSLVGGRNKHVAVRPQRPQIIKEHLTLSATKWS